MAVNGIFIPIDDVKAGMVTSDFISKANESGQTILAIKPNTELNQDAIERLYRHGIKEVPVKKSASGIVMPTLGITVPPVKPLMDDSLKKKAIEGVRNLFTLAESGTENMTTAYQAIKELDNVVDQLIDTISSANADVHISDLKSYDEYTYHHSLSVAVLAIAIGKGMGFGSDMLKKLGQAAILHDIGKLLVPIEIINKPGKLTDKEFAIAQQHAIEGGNYFRNASIGDTELWTAIAYHHEKINGRGYPRGLRGEEIPLLSRIISVADVYDALTSYRSYRKPMLPAHAAEIIMGEVSQSFFYEVVSVFLESIKMYPINTVLELSNKRRGVVVDNTNSMRPVLQMLDDGSTLDLLGSDNLSLMITVVMEE